MTGGLARSRVPFLGDELLRGLELYENAGIEGERLPKHGADFAPCVAWAVSEPCEVGQR